MGRRAVFVFVAAGLLVAGAIMLWLGSGGEADSGAAALVGSAHGEQAQAASPLPAARTQAQAPQSASLQELEAVAAPVVPDEMPAAYRRALGGLTGRILEHTPDDPDTLRPVAGMALELAGGRQSSVLPPRDALLDPAQLEARFVLGSAETDDEGRFVIESIDPRTIGALLLDPGGPRGMFWPLEVTPVSGETRDLGDLVLPMMATLTGTVVDEHSAPVAGARVRATDLPLPEAFAGVAEFRAGGGLLISAEVTEGLGDKLFLPPPSLARLESRLPFPTAYTDAEGRFELTGVPPGLVLLVADDGVHRPFARSGVATGAGGGRRDVGVLPMADGVPIAVRVEQSDRQPVLAPQVLAGSPIPGAPVAIMKTPADPPTDGTVRFSGLAEGRGWVAARADERHDFTIVSLPEVGGEVTITLQTPHALTLTVLDAGGSPLTGARFFGRALKENETPDFVVPPIALADRTQAGEDGRYVVSELEPTLWEITAIVEGHPQQRVNADLSAGDAALEVRLAAGHTATVRVVAAADGGPVEWAMVEAYPEEDLMELDLFKGPASRRRTDAQGVARFTALPPGPVEFTVSHPAYAIADASTDLPADDELRIELSAGGSIAGTVIEQGGPPAEPLLVLLVAEEASGDAEMPRFALTDREGRFRFDRVEPGPAELQARSRMEMVGPSSLFESLFNSPLAETTAEVAEGACAEVVLEVGAGLADTETGFVRGQLTVNGAAAAGWKVRTWGGEIRRSVSTDEQGRFDLGRVEAGEVDLIVSAPSQSLAEGFTDQREVELKPDEQLWVPIDLTCGAISGHVRSAATGAPLPGVQVAASADEEREGWGRRPETVSAPDGSFTIEPVVSGRYKLRARADGFAQASSEPFEVSAFQTRSGFVLRLPAALEISGSIDYEGAAEKPEWIWLLATGGDSGEGREGAQVDPEKLTFEFERLGPGEWSFELNTSHEIDFEPIKRTLTADTKGLKLSFKPAPPDPPEPPEPAADGSSPFVYEVK